MVLRAREVTARFLVARNATIRKIQFASWVNPGDTVFQLDTRELFHYVGPDSTLDSSWIKLAQGDTGATGAAGADGATGPQGEKGDQGDPGEGDLKSDGTVPLVADWDAGSYEIRARTLESDVGSGTPPLVVASTTKVTNLNADQLDGQSRALNINADHSHQSTGAQGGKLDHGAALNGRGDDDHTQYLIGRSTSAYVYNTGNQNCNNATMTAITHNSERWDDGGIHSTSSNTDRISPATVGKYVVGGMILWNTNANGGRLARIHENGAGGTAWAISTFLQGSGIATSDITAVCGMAYANSTGDYFSLVGYQTSGGVLASLGIAAINAPSFFLQRVV